MGQIVVKFSYRCGPCFGEYFAAEWDSGKQMLQIHNSFLSESTQPVTPRRWKGFWKKIDAMGAWGWPAEKTWTWDEVIEDGPSWDLELSDGQRHITLSGACGLPKGQDGRKPFASLIRALRSLHAARG